MLKQTSRFPFGSPSGKGIATRYKPKLGRVCFKKSPSASRRIVFFGKIWVYRHAAFWLPIGEPNEALTESLKTTNHLSGFIRPATGKEPHP